MMGTRTANETTDGYVDEQQPPIITRESKPILPLVVKDVLDKAREGQKHYGMVLSSHNGRDALSDAYQEAIDLCFYLRQALFERDGK